MFPPKAGEWDGIISSVTAQLSTTNPHDVQASPLWNTLLTLYIGRSSRCGQHIQVMHIRTCFLRNIGRTVCGRAYGTGNAETQVPGPLLCQISGRWGGFFLAALSLLALNVVMLDRRRNTCIGLSTYDRVPCRNHQQSIREETMLTRLFDSARETASAARDEACELCPLELTRWSSAKQP